jgi:hypothetical protein
VRSGAALFILRDLDRAVQRGRGPVHGADVHPLPDLRHASPPPLLAHHDPGEPWLKWGCPIDRCGYRVIIPHELEGHTAFEHPGWTATYELVRPYPNQLERVVYRQVEIP